MQNCTLAGVSWPIPGRSIIPPPASLLLRPQLATSSLTNSNSLWIRSVRRGPLWQNVMVRTDYIITAFLQCFNRGGGLDGFYKWQYLLRSNKTKPTSGTDVNLQQIMFATKVFQQSVSLRVASQTLKETTDSKLMRLCRNMWWWTLVTFNHDIWPFTLRAISYYENGQGFVTSVRLWCNFVR